MIKAVLTVEESYLPVALTAPGLTDAQFQELCEQYENYRIEYTAEGELLIMPLADLESSARNAEITAQLGNWARLARRGVVTDSSGGFVLPSGARLAPDAAWMSRERLHRRPSCPEFVIELLSPSDRPKKIQAKMAEWIAGGAELGWMIDPRAKSVTIYRRGQHPEVRTGVSNVAGEGPVEGFVLDLDAIWQNA